MPGALADSPSKVVRKMLIDLGLGTDGGSTWPVFYSNEPDVPDDAITVYDTEGRQQGRENVQFERQEQHGFQIRVRHGNYDTGYTKARAIAKALDDSVYQRNVAVGSNTYFVHCVTRTSDVLRLGRETPTSNRQLFTINAVSPITQR